MDNKDASEKLLEEFEKMLEEQEEDFGFYYPIYPGMEDLEYPDEDNEEEPPPLPKKVTCEHKNKKNIVTMTMDFWVCDDCGEDWDNENESK